jgi:hypothetical protein
MADVLPKLKRDGVWLISDRDGAQMGHRWGVVTSGEGVGVPLQRPPLAGEHLPAQIALKFEGAEEIRWWHLWWQVETLFGARRFAALILLPNGWRYCVCQMAGEPQQQDNRGYWLHVVLPVEILAEFEGEIV